VEQTLRARALQQHGRLVALPEAELEAATLAQAMSLALTQDSRLEVDLNGASNSAAMIRRWLGASA
jgi:predicted glycosyltransferase